MSVRIVYKDIAAGAAENASVTTQDAQGFSHVDALPFDGESPAFASLEPNAWLLDGSREIIGDQDARFWSTAMSGADGVFETPPKITILFGFRYTSPGMFLRGDIASGEYCSNVTIQWCRGETLLAEETFSPNSVEFFCEKTVEAYDRVDVFLNATSIPNRYAKLSQIMFGVSRTFLLDELRNVKITEEVSMISSEVAINTLDFTLDSATNVDYMFQLKQPVYAYDSSCLIGVFYINSSTRRGAGLYDISCIDAVGVLDEDMFPAAMYSGYPAKELLEEILGGHFELKLDTALSLASITGYLPPGTRRDALQQVAFALRAVVDTSGTEAIRVYLDREETPGRFPLNRAYTGGTVETSAIVTAVRVTAHTYSQAGSGNDTVEIGEEAWYHKGEAFEITNPKVTASDKQNMIEVDGATLVNGGNVAAIARHVYDYYAKRERQRLQIVMQGERPGDRIAAPTPWGTRINGYITRMDISLSGVAAADCEIIGTETKTSGDPEIWFSGEIFSGEV